MIDYSPPMIESLRVTILRLGLLGESELVAAIAECRQHLAKPGTAITMYTLAQVWCWKCRPRELLSEPQTVYSAIRCT